MPVQVRRAQSEDAAALLELNRIFDDVDPTTEVSVAHVVRSLTDNLTEEVYVFISAVGLARQTILCIGLSIMSKLAL